MDSLETLQKSQMICRPYITCGTLVALLLLSEALYHNRGDAQVKLVGVCKVAPGLGFLSSLSLLRCRDCWSRLEDAECGTVEGIKCT